jgi:hypothetical protein
MLFCSVGCAAAYALSMVARAGMQWCRECRAWGRHATAYCDRLLIERGRAHFDQAEAKLKRRGRNGGA